MIFLLIILNYVSAQSPITLYTPRGSNVYAHTRPELMSETDKLNWSDTVELYYPQATELNAPSATTTYNCHSYAWNMSEGGATCVLAYYSGDTDESIFWTDTSYIETTEALASKISYYSDDHSAIQTSTQGIYISKWGSLPLMQHSREYGPPLYQMSYRKYYRLNPDINASSSPLCEAQERTFTSNTSISGSTYTWSRDENNLDYVSGAGTTAYRVESLGDISDYAWVLLQITTPSGEVATTPYKYVWLGIPNSTTEIYYRDDQEFCVYENINFWTEPVNYNPPDTYYNWNILGYLNANVSSGQGTISPMIYSYEPGYMTLSVTAQNQCGSATTTYSENDEYYFDYCYKKFNLYPNPANDFLNIQLLEDPSETSVLDIFNSQTIKVMSTTLQSKEKTIDISNLPKGVYFVKVLSKGKVTTESFIKK